MGRQSRLKRQLWLKKHNPTPGDKLPIYQTDHETLPFSLSKIALISAIVTVLALLIVYLKPGLPAGHDIAAHAIRSRMMVEELSQGQFPVRWVAWIKNGESEPLFNFYQTGFYYLVALINLVLGLTTSLKIAPLLLWWSGSIFMFLWMRRFGNLSAALAALIYTFTPYIILDTLVRAAYPEIAAISFSVGLLWSSERLLITGKSYFAIPVSLCLAAILLSHLPTAVIIFPIIVGYLLLLIIKKQAKISGVKYLGISSLLGIGLAGFYIIPALGELNLIKSSLLSSDYYNFHQHFVYFQQLFNTFWGYGISKEGLDDGMSFQFGVIQWLIIAISIASLFIKKIQEKRGFIVFWLLCLLYALFFMHELSFNFWENIQAVSFVQYPWRYLMVVPIATAFLAALLTANLKEVYKSIAIFGSILLIIIFYGRYLAPSVYLTPDYFNIDTDQWRESRGVKENAYYEMGYLPKDVQQLPQGEINKWDLIQGKGQIIEKIIKNSQFSFVTDSKEPMTIRLNSHFFPGWKGYIDNVEAQLAVDQTYQYMALQISTGIHSVEFKFTNTPIRRVANIVSIISLLGLASWQIRRLLFHHIDSF